MDKDKLKRTPVNDELATLREERLPIFDATDRMWFPKNPNKYRKWVTDVRNAVQDYLDSGFQHCTHEQMDKEARGSVVGTSDPRERGTGESVVSIYVGRAHAQENAKAYLMEIDADRWALIKKLFEEDRMRPIHQIRKDSRGLKTSTGFYGEGLKDDAPS